jgi:hypothetical protein
VPANKLTLAERLRVLEVFNSGEFVDQPPLQVYATLLERGQYLCSFSTMYRILAEHDQIAERRRLARHKPRAVPQLVATGPGQVYSWDISTLLGPARGVYYDAYVMIDGPRCWPASIRSALTSPSSRRRSMPRSALSPQRWSAPMRSPASGTSPLA